MLKKLKICLFNNNIITIFNSKIAIIIPIQDILKMIIIVKQSRI